MKDVDPSLACGHEDQAGFRIVPSASAPLLMGNDWITLPLSAFITTSIAGSRPATNNRRCSRSIAIGAGAPAGAIGQRDFTCRLRESIAYLAFVLEIVVDHPLPISDCEFRSTAQLNRAHIFPSFRVNGCGTMTVTIESEACLDAGS